MISLISSVRPLAPPHTPTITAPSTAMQSTSPSSAADCVRSLAARVLAPAPSDSHFWDRKIFAGAVVVRSPGLLHQNTPLPYRMYYYGRAEDVWNFGVLPFNATLPTGRIGVAVSEDGVQFERFQGELEGGAVMDPSDDPAAFDCVHVAVGDVVFREDERRWYLYYFGGNQDDVPLPLVGFAGRRCKGGRLQLGLAFSEDGINFKERQGPILSVGDPGLWDENGVSWPRVLPPWQHAYCKEALAGKWLMSYHTRESGGPNGFGIFSAGIAVSDDGKRWEKMGKVLSSGAPGTWDEGGVSVRHIIYHSGQYLMFYEGSNYRFDFGIGVAISKDGLEWIKDTQCGPEPGGPVLKARKGENFWDNLLVGTPYVMAMPDKSLRMYYLGLGKREGDANLQRGIGLAVSNGSDFRLWKRYGE